MKQNKTKQNRPFSNRIVQASLLLMMLLFSISSFAQNCAPNEPNCHDDGEVITTGTRSDPWVITMYNNPFPNNYDGGWFDDWFGGGGSGQTAEEQALEEAKEEYCEAVDDLNAFLSALPITGTAATGYSIADLGAGNHNNILIAAYADITTFIGYGDHPDHYGNGVIQWNIVRIDWNIYNNWQGSDIPDSDNGGAQHIFANFVHTLGQGSGNSILTDPDPSSSCP